MKIIEMVMNDPGDGEDDEESDGDEDFDGDYEDECEDDDDDDGWEYCNLWRCWAGRVSTGSANGGWDTIHHPDPASLALW